MRIRTTIGVLTAAALLTLTACEGTEDTGSSKPDAVAEEPSEQTKQDTATAETDTEAADTDTEASADAGSETATLPDFTGQGLQEAQDGAQAAGFFILTSSDATGAGRMQVFDRNWTVCSQTPEPGEHPTSTTVNFDTVKIGESC
ncbi:MULTISPECIES: PASTA domain-containing protein [Streptomyces]|uniref:PASTA domain-containing protein n=1 Tax=Streptomyces chartreusis NRRL 3882 TaxID=1079985 RepID=A0A2N9BB17_STRCX|nr:MULTISPECIES: PASTA domain-containing protein [Streptomyces]MYS91453.1 hypothetical protein [Streptomyces sp. SID5464]SOR80561.1 hypothetical protein SCNRRL3882_4016 [Streptomyces chartreusis NRRL 3882]